MGRRDKKGGDDELMETAGMMRWLLTYADMLTLLFALFVVLYAMSAVDEARMRALAMALGNAFGLSGQVSVMATGATTDTEPIQMERSQVQLTTLREKVQKWILQRKLERDVKVRFNERGLVISLMTDKVLFDPGSAEMGPASRRMLSDVGELLKEVTNPIMVEGHTDDTPITRSRRYDDNWELSAARAVNVLKYLITAGVSPDRLSAAGYGSQKPLVPNIDDITRAKNRRIDIVVLKADLINDRESVSREMPLPSDLKVRRQIEKEQIESLTY
ncbi:MAG: OmpA/MotB family protein [bacterium]